MIYALDGIAPQIDPSAWVAADANLIEADAKKQNSTPKEDWDTSTIMPPDAPRAVREYLVVLDDAAFGTGYEVELNSHSIPVPPASGLLHAKGLLSLPIRPIN